MLSTQAVNPAYSFPIPPGFSEPIAIFTNWNTPPALKELSYTVIETQEVWMLTKDGHNLCIRCAREQRSHSMKPNGYFAHCTGSEGLSSCIE